MTTKAGVVEHAAYRISSFSGGGNCVAVAVLPNGTAAIRHSRRLHRPIVVSQTSWASFIDGVKSGEFSFARG